MWLLAAALVAWLLWEDHVQNEFTAVAATGKTELDQPAVRGRVVQFARSTFGDETLRARPQILRALMAIVNNEYDRRHRLSDQVGDRAASGGPSVGPMQVYRVTAKDLELWSPPENASDAQERLAYESMARDLDFCISSGVLVFADKLRQADDDVAEAIRRYNGSGQAARDYRAKAVAFAQSVWGEEGIA